MAVATPCSHEAAPLTVALTALPLLASPPRLAVGDVVLSVDGELLGGKWLPQLLATLPKRETHTFVVVGGRLRAHSFSKPARRGRRLFGGSGFGSGFHRPFGSGGGGGGSPRPSAEAEEPEFDVHDTLHLSNIYALKSWAIGDLDDKSRKAPNREEPG